MPALAIPPRTLAEHLSLAAHAAADARDARARAVFAMLAAAQGARAPT